MQNRHVLIIISCLLFHPIWYCPLRTKKGDLLNKCDDRYLSVKSTGMSNVCKLHKHYQNMMFSSMFNIFLQFSKYKVTTVQTNCIIFFQECHEIHAFCKFTCAHILKNHYSTFPFHSVPIMSN